MCKDSNRQGWRLLNQFLMMLSWGLECSAPLLATPIGWLLAFAALTNGFHAIRNRTWPIETWLFLAWPILMSVISIVWGMMHWADRNTPTSSESTTVLSLFLGLYVLGALLSIYINKRARAATAAVLSLGSFSFFGCAFVAGMAVTGDWL